MKKIILTITVLATLTTSVFAECLSGNCNNGYGLYEYNGGDLYEGYFKDGERNGYGTYLLNQSGDIAEGTWVNGAFQGKTLYEEIDDFFLIIEGIDLFFELLSY